MNDILVRGAGIAYHLIGLEATISVLSAGLLHEPTGCPGAFVAEVAAVAKRDLPAGASLDGEGGYTEYGALVAAERAVSDRLLPIGLSDGLTLRRAVRRGQLVTLDDVEPPARGRTLELRAG